MQHPLTGAAFPFRIINITVFLCKCVVPGGKRIAKSRFFLNPPKTVFQGLNFNKKFSKKSPLSFLRKRATIMLDIHGYRALK